MGVSPVSRFKCSAVKSPRAPAHDFSCLTPHDDEAQPRVVWEPGRGTDAGTAPMEAEVVNVEIRRLTPELVSDYVHFFDTTPHATHKDEHRCYCVWWCSEDYEGRDLASSVDNRRDYAVQCIKYGHIQGYLAYCDGKAIGWCNANTKTDCLGSYCWRRVMGAIPTEDPASGVKVKSIFCFAIAPEMHRRGVAGRLVERVCSDAAEDGFHFVEAYPNREFSDVAEDCMGPVGLYRKSGFTVCYETENKLVMRKQLK